MQRRHGPMVFVTIMCLATGALAAPSLPVAKPPVIGANSGPSQDPHSIKGQWFTNLTELTVEFRPCEFHDNVAASGGGAAGATAVRGKIVNLLYAGPPPPALSPIAGFTVDATIENDSAPDLQGWLPGSNQHNESLLTESSYSGPLHNAKLAVEFAIVDTEHIPQEFTGPYTNANAYYFVADNEDQWAWYCWSPAQPSPGNYYVPTWDFGTIPLGQSATRTLQFVVDGAGIPAGDPLYGQLRSWYAAGTDILANRTTSLKISTWIDALSPDLGLPYVVPPMRGSDCSVFHDVLDYGDAPDPTYATLAARDGARHWLDPMVRLGVRIDGEGDGQPTAAADGDDVGGADDEDGVSFSSAIAAGQPVDLVVIASAIGKLDAWIDFNVDGDWLDANEQVFTGQPLAVGANALSFTAPTGLAATNTYARFRFSTAGGLAPTGLAPDGEVEDYRVALEGGAPGGPGLDVKWSQPPDCESGLDVKSYTAINEPVGVPLVADDWLCDGRPITGLRWWGSYVGWHSFNQTPGEAPPLPERPDGFRVTWYQDIPAEGGGFSRPGAVIATTNFPLVEWGLPPATGSVYESWYCMSDLGYVQENMVEHEYEYELIFPPDLAWNEKEGTVYWLGVQALYEGAVPAVNQWGWKTTHPQNNWNDDACRILGGVPSEMTYPPPGWESVGSAHPHFGQSVNMAFELLTDVVGRRAKKWVQPPNVLLGADIRSWSVTNDLLVGYTSADDWLCDGRRITDIHWWGSYLGYMTNTPGEVRPPAATAKPVGFFLSWYHNAAGMPGEPPITNVFIPYGDCHEVYYGTGTNFGRYEHEFQYYADLLNGPGIGPWLEASGTVYWLGIRAAFAAPWAPGVVHEGWGWLSTPPSGGWGSASQTKIPGGGWGAGYGYDLAFELTTDQVGTGPYWWNQPIAFRAIVQSNLVYSVGDAGSGVQVLQWCTNLASGAWANLATNRLPLPAPYTNLWRDIPPVQPVKFYRVKQTATP